MISATLLHSTPLYYTILYYNTHDQLQLHLYQKHLLQYMIRISPYSPKSIPRSKIYIARMHIQSIPMWKGDSSCGFWVRAKTRTLTGQVLATTMVSITSILSRSTINDTDSSFSLHPQGRQNKGSSYSRSRRA